jgi:hypothetical protein
MDVGGETLLVQAVATAISAISPTLLLSGVGLYEALGNALRAKMKAELETVLGLPVAYDNEPEPVATGTWAEVVVNFPDAEQTHIGGGSIWRISGFVEIRIHTALDIGAAAAHQVVDSVWAATRNAQLETGLSYAPYAYLRDIRLEPQTRDERWWRADLVQEFYADAEPET